MDRVPWIQRPLEVVLGLLMGAFSVVKIAQGHDPRYWLPVGVFYASALVELLATVMLLEGWWLPGLVVVVALGVGGGAVGIMARGTPCGCLAGLAFPSWRWHVTTCAVLALAGAWLLRRRIRRGWTDD